MHYSNITFKNIRFDDNGIMTADAHFEYNGWSTVVTITSKADCEVSSVEMIIAHDSFIWNDDINATIEAALKEYWNELLDNMITHC